ncbi:MULTISPECIES: hypothetical protein [Streptomyces]|uniref:Uncharacterized protein n=1 Tax=Streptomyces arboris TaxID=2600619 RepID=A0A5N5ENM2_9ACTN|nr:MULTISPECIES: hypothetical protein [Streptomyces]KAB2592579.1 hypothetical protein F5983_10900 [Streptomyces arboris]
MPAEERRLLSTGLPTDHPLYYPEWWRANLSSEGDFTDVVGLPDATRSHHVPFLSRVDVLAHEHVTTVAVHGTSFTEAWTSVECRLLATTASRRKPCGSS